MKNCLVLKNINFLDSLNPWYQLLLVFITSNLLLSCASTDIERYTKITPPEIKYKKHQLVSVSNKVVKLNVLFEVNNPNNIAIDSFFLNYELFVDNKSFIKGLKVKLKLIPKGKSEIVLPIDIGYTNLLSNFSSVAKLIIQGKRKLLLSANVDIFGEYSVVGFVKHDFRFKEQIKMAIPLPRYKLNDVMQYIQGVR